MSFLQTLADPGMVALVAAIISAIPPVTVHVYNKAKLNLQRQAQEHKIVQGYLDRALDPVVPLAIRQQLLRFLSTPSKDGRQLEVWAKEELKRVDSVVEGLDRPVVEAERALHEAKDAKTLKEAERRLAEAVRKKNNVLKAPGSPPPTPAALKAGLYTRSKSELVGIDMSGQDLAGMEALYSPLMGANFSGADLHDSNFQGSDLRGVNFSGADLSGAGLHMADLRAADLRGSDLRHARLHQSHLEGADLRQAKVKGANLRAIYDDDTKWPDGFDPVAAGAVRVDGKEPIRVAAVATPAPVQAAPISPAPEPEPAAPESAEPEPAERVATPVPSGAVT